MSAMHDLEAAAMHRPWSHCGAITDRRPTKVLYVGMTRARQKLVLTGSEDTPWVERIAALAA